MSEEVKKPYSEADYRDAKDAGYDLDVWQEYCEYYGLDDVIEAEE